jgi:hypothetical protein
MPLFRIGDRGCHREREEGDMATIDYATCGVDDAIAYSLKLHPQLLANHLRLHARVHAEFADAYGDHEVLRNELGLADRLRSFANAIELGDHAIPDDIGVRHEAFSCAAWLQDLHPIMQKAIVERGDARDAPLVGRR